MPPPGVDLPQDEARPIERALRATYQVLLPAMVRRGANLGFGRCTIATEKGWDYYVSLGRDLGVWAEELLYNQDPVGRSIRRIEMSHMEDAGAELCEFVRRMPSPVRIVVECRSCGVAWKKMTTELPDRAYFSMRDDWTSALAAIRRDAFDVVRRLS